MQPKGKQKYWRTVIGLFIGATVLPATAVASQQSVKAYVDGKFSSGWSGTFTNGDGATVTVANGIITGVA